MGRFDECKLVLAMIMLQFIYAGVALFTKAAFLKGMNPRVFVVYRQGIATLVMVPLACISMRRKSINFSIGIKGFVWIFLASLIGITANQNAYFEGLFLTSSTAASAMTNLIPAITFVMATMLGFEKINIRSLRSIAKIIGTVICVSGAISMALIKGPKLLNSDLLPSKSLLGHEGDDWLLGCISLFGASCFWSSWMILQVPISASCPDHLYSSALMGFLATIESAIVALSLEMQVAAWQLNSYLELGCCLYAGIGLAVSFFVQSWCISQRGPLFCAMFNPLYTVIVAVIAAIFLREETHLGSLIGALAVVIGLYVVLWGKAKDLREISKNMQLMLPNDDSTNGQVITKESSKTNGKTCLEEPLISNKNANLDEDDVLV